MVQEHTAQERARERARYLTGPLWHAGTFVIITAFFWVLDLVVGASGRQVEERKTAEYLRRDGRDPTRP